MAPFRLTCLGPPVLYGPDGDPIRFRTRKHFALLIYLAVEPGIPHRRDRLATLLWGDAEVDEARHSLATALSMIRGRLGTDLLDAERESVRLVPGRILTDLQELKRDDVDADDEGPLGPFLEEFDIPDATDYQQWKDGLHARVLPSVHSAVALRIEHCRRRGDSRRMETLGHRLQRIDELSEEAARAVLDIRSTPDWTHDELAVLLREQLDCEVVVTSTRLVPCETPAGSPLLAAAQRAHPAGASYGSPTCSDWCFLRHLDAIKVGPGTSRRSHTPDESVNLSEVIAARGFYARVIEEYFA